MLKVKKSLMAVPRRGLAMHTPAAVLFYFFALVGGGLTEGQAASRSSARALAIEHVTVLSMTPHSSPLHDVTVVIQEGRVASITPSAKTASSPGLALINGSGKWLMPGLSRLHSGYTLYDSEHFRSTVRKSSLELMENAAFLVLLQL